MGITFNKLTELQKLGLFKDREISILDIGSSNLYSASKNEIDSFIKKYKLNLDHDPDNVFSKRLSQGSGYDPEKGGLNESFIGELFEYVGMEYLSFDIAKGFNTQIFDLNIENLDNDLVNKFDIVLNFGTTEHLLNQFNAFKVIHEATKVGGYIVHSLPSVGFVDHGYVTYTGRFFFDLAGHNEYEIIDFKYEYGETDGNLYQSAKNYKTYFPILENVVNKIGKDGPTSKINEFKIPDISIQIVYRKVKDSYYTAAVESSTSVGELSSNIIHKYKSAIQKAKSIEVLSNKLKNILKR